MASRTDRVFIDFSAMKRYMKALENIQNVSQLKIARKVQQHGFEAMQTSYYATSSNNRRRYRPGKYSLQREVFSKLPPNPIQVKPNVFAITLLPDFNALKAKVPQLVWQEYGTKTMIDSQPYRILPNGKLGPITKKEAIGMRQRRMGNLPRQIKMITVPHYGLKARGFILAGHRAIKGGFNPIATAEYKEVLKQQGMI